MARNSSHRSAPPPRSQLRIIGGRWRGRKLQFAAVAGLRPTGDRLRETLFNWLQCYLPGTHCLDLFAGSGALGLEALSRGATSVDFVELNTQAVRTLKEQLQLVGAFGAQVYNCSAHDFLAGTSKKYDIVFVDPPFAGNLWQESFNALENHLAQEALVYVETPRNTALPIPPHWQLGREKATGQVCMRLYHCAPSCSAGP
ncbi:16S rRNA (guanine(966)-N(2))-methyltransferase RsmD [Microbulbifer sp. 2205BS26-8]|uniref:Ribosomal RNA small subunit methyltransferase D n=1 Tax=Microbulbifer spongiae TaxID=2944933 RepID=A0ABY9E9W1_9GAMM|nr:MULTISPECIES: 16S rRNA (guanine(966)-N(2))-methyltransferase RsmD [unclassified Microbulbifer]MDP5210485.1 16S rRNA (guanine(966)-N(2))-methyltransferase RsmD [Microbulbifer sp. 2205BS26-8]WKD49793.1 16S rRNA (guanine(966)-N(2))-methyltransferase RsmD [Microbulbifer sp. MI-G]